MSSPIIYERLEGIMNGSQTFRVANKCKYDIGVPLMNGQDVNIPAGSNYIRLSVDDILRIEGMCHKRKVFSAGMLVPITDDGVPLKLEELGGYTDAYTDENQKHLTDEEIEKNLKKPFKAFEAWLKKIDDPTEIESVIAVAKKIDAGGSKLRLIQAKVPNRDLLDEDDEE